MSFSPLSNNNSMINFTNSRISLDNQDVRRKVKVGVVDFYKIFFTYNLYIECVLYLRMNCYKI